MINVFTDAENIDFGGNVGNFEIKDAAVLLVKYNAKGDAEWVQKVMFAGYTFNYKAKRLVTLLARKGVAKIACRCRSQNKIRR